MIRPVLLLISMLLITSACQRETQKVYPEIGPLTTSVYASATVQPDSLYAVHASAPALVVKNWVQAGDVVKRGDVLLELEHADFKLKSNNAQLSLELAKAQYSGKEDLLEGLRQELKSAELTYQNDSVNYFRQQRLWQNKIGSKNELDQRELTFEVARNQVKRLQNSYFQKERELLTQLEQAQNNYQSSLLAKDDYLLRSKINGRVYKVEKEIGELTALNEPLAYVGSADRFIIELLVDEEDVVRLSQDQQVLLVLDAYLGEVFEARVSRIHPKMDERSQTFLVEAEFVDQPSVLFAGLTGEANIVIARRDSVLTVPLSYVGQDQIVLTSKGPVKVETGIQNLERIEVLSGLSTESVLRKPN